MSDLLIRGGLVQDAVHEEAYVADILVQDGKIAAIGENLSAEGAQTVNAAGLNVFPGLVECHGHIGLDGWAVGYEGRDYNEYNDPVTPHLRAIDGLNPMDESIRDAALGGVTTLCTGPGSSNVLGGTFAAFKPVGRCIDDMVILPEAAMKCAFGENPKRCYKDKGISSRMTNAAKLREMLFKAKEYMEKLDAAGDDASKRPAFDMKLNALVPVLRRQIPLKAHAHQANDILTAIRIAREFNVRLTLEHVTEGALIIPELLKANVPLAVGQKIINDQHPAADGDVFVFHAHAVMLLLGKGENIGAHGIGRKHGAVALLSEYHRDVAQFSRRSHCQRDPAGFHREDHRGAFIAELLREGFAHFEEQLRIDPVVQKHIHLGDIVSDASSVHADRFTQFLHGLLLQENTNIHRIYIFIIRFLF